MLFIVITSYYFDDLSKIILPDTVIGLYSKEFWENLLVEAHGMVIELFIVGVLVISLDSRREKHNEIARLKEDLNDYAMLDFPEINVKKQGHLKRLHDAGIYTINIQNLILNELHLNKIKITDSKMIGLKIISGSLSNSSFLDVMMRSSNFEKSVIKNTNFEKCNLYKAKFKDSRCRGMSLRNSSVVSVDFTNCDLQSAIFVGADIANAIFIGANLKQASFLHAKNINIHELAKANCLDYISLPSEHMEELKKIRPDMNYQRNVFANNRT